jgi:hypothetical protein
MRSLYRFIIIGALSALLTCTNAFAQVRSQDSSRTPQTENYLQKLEKTNSEMRWHWLSTDPPMLSIFTKYGPCGTVSALAPNQIAFNTGKQSDSTIHLYPSWKAASFGAWQYCGAWYTQEKADRSSMQEINERWTREHPDRTITDTKRPLFTRDGTFGCPSQEATYYAEAAKDHGWRYAGSLAGVDDPIGKPSKADQDLSPEYYGCKTYKDGVPVEFVSPAPTGSYIRTSIGWVSEDDLRN